MLKSTIEARFVRFWHKHSAIQSVSGRGLSSSDVSQDFWQHLHTKMDVELEFSFYGYGLYQTTFFPNCWHSGLICDQIIVRIWRPGKSPWFIKLFPIYLLKPYDGFLCWNIYENTKKIDRQLTLFWHPTSNNLPCEHQANIIHHLDYGVYTHWTQQFRLQNCGSPQFSPLYLR